MGTISGRARVLPLRWRMLLIHSSDVSPEQRPRLVGRINLIPVAADFRVPGALQH
jgi:hypothetical protein